MNVKKVFRPKYILPFVILLFLPLFLTNLQSVKKLFTQALYSKANISINASKKMPNFLLNWLSFAQGGEEPGVNMLKPTVSSMTALNPQYIRIDHIFDDDYYGLVQPKNGSIVYDFTNLDAVVNSITKAGAKPLLVLSYMPQVLNPDKTGLPDNWQAWQNLVTKTIEHYSGIYDRNIPDVYYEVWNEPDLESFGNFDYYGNKNYLQLYLHSAQAATKTRFCNPYKIGGPSTANLYENWVKALLDFAAENQLPLDFLSYHQYSYSPKEYQKNADNLQQWLNQYPSYQNTEILLTEWGPDSSPSPFYNGTSAAAFTLATIATVGPTINKAFTFEIIDGINTNSWGIIGKNEEKTWLKPRYHLFSWLAEMNSLLSSRGDGTFVKAIAGQKNNVLNIIITNYDPNGSHREMVPIRVFNLKPGSYQVIKQCLLDSPANQNLTINSSVFTDEVYMPANTVCRLQLIPL
jgi:hypothetical protein